MAVVDLAPEDVALGQVVLEDAAQPLLQRAAELEPRDVGADAAVRAEVEGDVALFSPREPEPAGAVVQLRVARGCENLLVAGDDPPAAVGLGAGETAPSACISANTSNMPATYSGSYMSN